MFNYLRTFFSSNSLFPPIEYDNIECLNDSARTYTVLETTHNKSSVPHDLCSDNVENSALKSGQETQSNED